MSDPKFPPMPTFTPGNAANNRTTLEGAVWVGESRYEPPIDWQGRAEKAEARVVACEDHILNLESALGDLIEIVEDDPEAQDTTKDLYSVVLAAKVVLDPSLIGQATDADGGSPSVSVGVVVPEANPCDKATVEPIEKATPLIVSTPGTLSGAWRIAGTRIDVRTIQSFGERYEPESILKMYPHLTLEQIKAALDFKVPRTAEKTKYGDPIPTGEDGACALYFADAPKGQRTAEAKGRVCYSCDDPADIVVGAFAYCAGCDARFRAEVQRSSEAKPCEACENAKSDPMALYFCEEHGTNVPRARNMPEATRPRPNKAAAILSHLEWILANRTWLNTAELIREQLSTVAAAPCTNEAEHHPECSWAPGEDASLCSCAGRGPVYRNGPIPDGAWTECCAEPECDLPGTHVRLTCTKHRSDNPFHGKSLHDVATDFTKEHVRDLSEASTSTIRFRARLAELLGKVHQLGANETYEEANHEGWLTGLGLAAGIVRGKGLEETAKQIDDVAKHCPGEIPRAETPVLATDACDGAHDQCATCLELVAQRRIADAARMVCKATDEYNVASYDRSRGGLVTESVMNDRRAAISHYVTHLRTALTKLDEVKPCGGEAKVKT